MPAHAPAPRGAHRHARRAQGGAAAATSTPRPRSRLLRLGLPGVLVLCLLGFSPSAWVAPAVAQVVGGGTPLINETFKGTSVPDPDFTVHRSTCLTGASGTPPDGQAQIPDCAFPDGPHGDVPPIGLVPGYLQLTDARGSRAGDILYNRPLPATAGLIATFDQWQYGGSTAGDGMAFFLIDGATQLTQIGGGGGSLGYAQRLVLGEPGIRGGVLGLGLDVFGNYYNDDEGRGTGCPPALKPPFPTAVVPNVVTLRGPGDLDVGYCYLGSTTMTSLLPALPHPPESTLPGLLRAETLELAQRSVRITVQPTTGSVAPRIIVEMDFHDELGLQRVLNLPAPPNLPATYKFGWTGSGTGGNDVHLLRNVVVSTVAPLHQLDLVKQLDRTNDLPDPLVAGSVVRYQFLVTNGGIETLTDLQVQDATLGTVACPITALRPAPGLGSSVVCTGSHTLTQAEVDAGVFTNTATATALNPADETVTSNPSTVRLVVGTGPRLALQRFVVEPPPYVLGQQVTFRYNLTNEGDVTLTNPRVTDNPVAGVVCLQSSLRSAPAFGAATVCTGTHVLQASDLDASGAFTSTAVGFADPQVGSPVASDSVTLSLPVGTDIAVTKGVEPPAPVLGEVLTYTVTATNQGAVDATGVKVTDVLPAGIPFFAALPPPGTTYEPATGVWTIGPLARGASVILLLQGRVIATGPQTNVARLTGLDQLDSNPANNQAAATVEERTPFADLAVTQTVSNTTPLVEETVIFTVTATNDGPDAASGLKLSDGVRAGLVLVRATPSQGIYKQDTGEWALGALPVQAQATLTLVVQVVQAGEILNVATKTAGDQVDPNISNNYSVVALTSEPVADLQVHKTVDQRVPPLGSDVTFTVTVTNAGPSAASGVAVTDVLPEGLALVSFTPSQGTYTPATGEWALGALAAGTQTTLTLRATVEAVGPLTNRAAKTAQTERDPNPANDASGVTVNGQEADVQVVTTVDRPTPLLGETVTFTVTVTNNGPNVATGVQVRDVLSERLTFVGATASHGTYTAATGLWEVGTLPRTGAAATATLQIMATVTRVGPLTHLVVKINQDQPDPNPTNDQDRLTLPGQPLAELVVTKSNGVRSVVPGTEVTYTVVVTNRGPRAVTGATVSDPIPLILVDPSQRLPSFAGLTWTCVASAGSRCPVGGTGNVLATVDLLVGGTATFTLRGRVTPTALGTVANTATVIAPAEVLDPLQGTNSATDTDRLTPLVDLRLTKTDHGTGTAPGGLLLYTLVVTNTGPSAVTGARVVDPVPAGLTGVTWTCTASPGSRCPAAGTGGIDVTVDLLAGGTATFTILATVDPAATGTLVNQATVTGPPGTVDADGSNNTATEPTEILPIPISTTADLTLVKTDNLLSTVPGAPVQYTLVVRNNGPDDVQGAAVIDAVPATLTEVTWLCRASPGSHCPAPASGTGPLAVRVDLLSDGLVLFRIDATVAATASGTLRNVAAVLPPPGTQDPTPGNNVGIDTDTVTTPSTPSADLTITKTDHGTGTAPGGLLLYTLLVTNQGPSAVTGARVVDPVPAGLTGVTWTCTASPGSRCPAAGTGGIDVTVDLLAGGTATFTILATVDPAATGTLVNQATVTPPPGTVDADGSTNTATEPTEILSGPASATADLTLVKTNGVSSTVPGATVQYTLVVRNNGPDAVQGATVIDAVPATLTEVIWTCRASPGSHCPTPASGTGPIAVRVDLLSGGAVLFRIDATVAAPVGGTLRNVAAVLPSPGTRDPTPGNNVVIDTDTVTSAPVGLGPMVFHPPAGRKTVQTIGLPDLEWRVVWRNNANALPLLVRLLEPIPAATTYVDGSVTCVAQGLSLVEFCDFDAATNQVVADAILGADLGASTEAQAANDVVITFQTTVLPGATEVTNQALAHWDATDTGSVDDDISAGQLPVETGTAFGQNDPTVVTLPGLACLFQQRLLALTMPPSAPTTSSPPPSDGADGGSGGDGAVDAGVDRQSTPEREEVFVLLTPLESDTVAGSTLTLASGQVPVAGTTVSQPTEIRIANGAPAATLAIVENVGSKTERLPAHEAHDVVTADGVVVAFPATVLAAPDTLRLERVDPTTAPGPLPGVVVRPLVALTLAGGGTAFSSAVALSLPYADADQDGLVDETSPALPELSLTVWVFDAARGSWMHLPEARVLTAFNALRVATTQTGLYGVFRAADGRTGLAGTTGPASPAPRSAGAQGSGWQDIGEVTTFPFLVPVNTTTLPNGTYEVRAICATTPAELRAAAGSAPTTSTVLRTSGGGGGGCSLRPGGGWSRATALDTLGNLGLPLLGLLVLGLWAWRRPR